VAVGREMGAAEPPELRALLLERLRLLEQLHLVTAKIDAFKQKCRSCDHMLLPGHICPQCGDASAFVPEEA